MIQHVYERVRRATRVQGVFVATDDQRICDAVEGFGGRAVMTAGTHQSGTDRIAEAVTTLGVPEGDVIVNVQGDEPMIMPEMVDEVIGVMDDERASMGTLARRIEQAEEIGDPNVVKVVFSDDGYALYFSRSPIPYHRDGIASSVTSNESKDKERTDHASRVTRYYFKHIGIYAYRRNVLMQFAQLPPSRLEQIEKLEQLRALEHGFTIKVKQTVFETIGVDTPKDLERVEQCLNLSL
jgi:3-deoxy-manno-octulosonate cytidylyltransferase (CMP-KDO synthetase)